ncbi:chloride channel protein [Tsukamurella soli]|uniref:Chloride channel protein n=1 Tax=Tsukamurella soli TaxID=644556 RepID=A0ABP8J3D7_9ACTN
MNPPQPVPVVRTPPDRAPRWLRPALPDARGACAVVLVGVAGGIGGAIAFTVLHAVQLAVFGFAWQTPLEAADLTARWARFGTLVAAGVVASFAWWAVRRRGSALVSVEAAVAGERMPFVSTLVNAVIQIVAVALGASIGKEVAPREIGGLLSQTITRGLGLNARRTRTLVACGAAAGLAAIYHAPLGGAVFAVEVLIGEIALGTVVPALAASAIATLVAQVLVHTAHPFAVPQSSVSPALIVWSIVAGPVFGVGGLGFLWLTKRARTVTPNGRRLLLVMPATFAAVGAVGMIAPQILGNGIALGEYSFHLPSSVTTSVVALLGVGALGVVKGLATSASLGSGAVGGTLMPSIAMGAALGACLGGLWTLLWPGSAVAAYAVLGATAFLATTSGAPLTAVVLVAELTGQPALVVPAVLVVAGAIVVRRRLDLPRR